LSVLLILNFGKAYDISGVINEKLLTSTTYEICRMFNAIRFLFEL